MTGTRILFTGGAGDEPTLRAGPAQTGPGATDKTAERPGQGTHLLLVDDEVNVLRASATLLELLGYQTTGFTDPREALAAFRSAPQRFDLVLTDLLMPQMSGQELAKAVHAVRAELPVIVTTGRDLSEEDLRAFGISAVLQKPWRVEDAIKVLRGLR